MDILITGASGFVGHHIRKTLLADSHFVHSLVRPSTQKDFPNQYVFTGDVDSLRTYLNKHRISTIIHCASFFKHTPTDQDIAEIIDSNINLGTQILAATQASPVKWFINTGSSWQHYENSSYSPVNLYAATKQAFESILVFYQQAYGLKAVTLKLFDTYGSQDRRGKIINTLLSQKNNLEPLKMSDGYQLLDLCHVSDVSAAYAHLIKTIECDQSNDLDGKFFGVSSGERISLRNLVALMEEVGGRKIPVKWGALPTREREVVTPWSNFPSLPGWKPNISLREGLGEVLGFPRSSI